MAQDDIQASAPVILDGTAVPLVPYRPAPTASYWRGVRFTQPASRANAGNHLTHGSSPEATYDTTDARGRVNERNESQADAGNPNGGRLPMQRPTAQQYEQRPATTPYGYRTQAPEHVVTRDDAMRQYFARVSPENMRIERWLEDLFLAGAPGYRAIDWQAGFDGRFWSR